jgi:hypothetical protein
MPKAAFQFSLAVDLDNPGLGFDDVYRCQETQFQPDHGEPITLYLSLGERGSVRQSHDPG